MGTFVMGKRMVKEIGRRHTVLKDESEWFKIPNHHPAIVSVDVYVRANASIKRFSLSNKKPRDYLLR
ncbi:recombinase family protein, partial [Coprococcus eutactus]|uniref:recombinase family protein n=1 Tax=Coprococcus eutactus TaxID=33043 RepID=UPI0021096D62|nr:recombinase family protein [Coprococcus eutactus]